MQAVEPSIDNSLRLCALTAAAFQWSAANSDAYVDVVTNPLQCKDTIVEAEVRPNELIIRTSARAAAAAAAAAAVGAGIEDIKRQEAEGTEPDKDNEGSNENSEAQRDNGGSSLGHHLTAHSPVIDRHHDDVLP